MTESSYATAAAIIVRALDRCQRPYIAFSGGKDSLVVAHLVHQVDPGVQMIYCDDELLYPKHVDFIRRVKDAEGDRLHIMSGGGLHREWFCPWMNTPYWREPEPEMQWLPSVGLQHRGQLAKLAPWLGYDGLFMGLRRAESLRRAEILKTSKGIDKKRHLLYVNPLIEWSDDDVWDY